MKNEKSLYLIVLASTTLILFIILVSSTASAAVDALEIRGQVASGTGSFTWNANNFAGFYYDIDNDVSAESLRVFGISGNVIPAGDIVYSTSIRNANYEYENAAANWIQYPVIGFFGDGYVPLKDNDASKLARLVLDIDDKYTVRTGETLDLGYGYSLLAKQVDVQGQKVWLEFDKDGEYVHDQIVSTEGTDSTWTCKLNDIQGEDNVPVLKVHVNEVFQGAVDSIALIDGLWLIDYANDIRISSDDEFGKLNNVAISGPSLVISNDDTMTLTKGSDVEIGQGMYFKVADSNDLRFYAYKEEITELGTYQVRGQVASGNAEWNATNFAGFFYDLKKNVATENLKVSGLKGNVIPKNGLEYSTTVKNVDYKSKDFNGSYPVLGFFAEEYVPLKANDASKLAKLVKDSDDKVTLKTGYKLDLGHGYSLTAKQVDFGGKKVWLEFDKDGKYVDDEIISVGTGSNTWTCKLNDIQGEDNVPVLRVHVNKVFQGAVDSIAQIEGLWLIDYANAMTIESDDEFGKLNDVSINGATLNIKNDDTVALTRDSTNGIAEGMYFKIADSDDLRYYPFVERIIGDNVLYTETGNVIEDVTTPSKLNVLPASEGNYTAVDTPVEVPTEYSTEETIIGNTTYTQVENVTEANSLFQMQTF